jgi:glycosyltransferase involved in cell wall biosynthesis
MVNIMEQPLVAVIIPAFNSEATIKRAVDSALNQDYPNMEIIVIDDGSTDNTQSIVQSYPEPVKCLHQENSGPDTARNLGINSTHAEYIAFLDADDEWLPARLSKTVQPMINNPDIGITWCRSIERMWDGTEKIRGESSAVLDRFSTGFWIDPRQCTPATTCQRSMLLDAACFDRPLIAFADVDLWIRIRELSGMVEIPEPLVIVHNRPDSRSRNKNVDAVRDACLQVIHDALERRPDLYAHNRKSILAEAWFRLGHRYKACDDFKYARQCFRRSFAHLPTRCAMQSWLGTFIRRRKLINRIRDISRGTSD